MPDFGKPMRLPINISSADNRDLLAVLVFFIGGTWFLWNVFYWAGISYIGNAQHGDAAFWWNGALHFAEGIIEDNPNLDYRMGYALIAGLFVAVLGGSFFLFHKVLIVAFLLAASFFYFALKPALGRIAAAGAVALMIFNPFAAEWLAISTSDSVGLILNIAALSCFIFGLRNSLHLGFLAAFGFLLASASLTRPLMSPFVAPAIVILVLHGTLPWKRRFQATGAVLTAFAVPTVLWVIALHGITGSWAMAGQDSTTFYAASDPQIQVWSPTMYEKVEDSARRRYGTQAVTPAQVDKEFWQLTKENYATNIQYHFSRLLPHTLDIAKFSNRHMSRTTPLWDLMRRGFMAALVLGLAIFSALQGRRLEAYLVGLAGFSVVIFPPAQAIVVLGSAILFSVSALRPQRDRTYAAIAFYWWTGVAALFLVGGTWGPPLGAVHAMNALGYRLGSQFFFVNDVITVAMLGLIATRRLSSIRLLKHFLDDVITVAMLELIAIRRLLSVLLLKYFLPEEGSLPQAVCSVKQVSNPYAASLLSLATIIFVSGLVLTGIAGAVVVSYRAWQRTHEVPQSFPALGQFQTWWQENQTKLNLATPLETVTNISDLNGKIGTSETGGTASHYLLFVGGMSDFIWNFDGQGRSRAIIYSQKNISPFSMSPNLVYAEFPSHLHESDWVKRQGAWIIRRLADIPSKSTLPFYYSEASVKAFVPLSTDKKQFDFSAVQVFPLQEYASQLHAAGALKAVNAVVEWEFSSGTEKYPRRFSLKRDATSAPAESVVLELDMSKTLGARSLSFRWLLDRAPNSKQSIPASTLSVVGEPDASKGDDKRFVFYTSGLAVAPEATQSAKIDLTQSKYAKVKLILDGVMPDDKIWFYEFNMQSDEFLQ